ncbi:hypothetical protein GOV09_05490 [Candidatus Woesearchaeota archaeon]|nr:hypothetical protein [Candidatus Woesearchaeota archaeon]
MAEMKKGITPLVSTILLLGFAIGLGTLVMSWGAVKDFSCKEVELGIVTLEERKEICLTPSSIEAVVENNGPTHIDRLKIVLLTQDAVLTEEMTEGIAPGSFKKVSFPLSGLEVTQILKIRVIPSSGEEDCISKRVELERLRNCQ